MNRQKPRAIGIVRVSQRDDDSGHSPEVQARAMVKLAQGEVWDLAPDDILDENVDTNGKVRKVSGGWDLDDRPKLRYALEQIETGAAQVVVAERLDRLFRDFDHQRAFVNRVEAAGGRIVTANQGAISHATAETEMAANMNGVVAQYVKRTAKERSWKAVELAIEQGTYPGPWVPPGLLRAPDGTLTPDSRLTPVIERAYEMRAEKQSIPVIRAYLRANGIERSPHGVRHLLACRLYLGEIHFGDHAPNLAAHEPIVSRDLFDRVQKVTLPRGRPPKSDRLLARLGVLRCACCEAKMTVGYGNGSQFLNYRCPNVDCTGKPTISGKIIEPLVVERVKAALADAEGRASAESNVREAEVAANRARTQYEAAVAVLEDFTDQAAVNRLLALRAASEAATERLEQIRPQRATVTINAAADWDQLSPDARRDLIRAVVDRVTVAPGRGADRITVKLMGE